MLLQKGNSGANVTYLQYGLHIMCFSPGGFDGVFGDNTYNAVKRFQSAYGLSNDGIVGDATWNKLCSEIRSIQNQLNNKGFNIGTVDGVAGPNTYSGVISFQKANGLSADGQVGSATRTKLFSSGSGSNSGYSRLLKVTSPLMYGDDVKAIQNKLNSLGYNAGTADGYYGDNTYNAVIRFQSANRLSTDGQVGPATWNALFSTSGSVVKDITDDLKSLMLRYQYMYISKYSKLDTIPKLATFYSLVNDKAILDLKNQGWNDPYYVFNGIKVANDGPGNILYGYVGTAFGYSSELLLRAAGYNQQGKPIYNPENGVYWGNPPYGDDPRDQAYIKYGIAYYHKMNN